MTYTETNLPDHRDERDEAAEFKADQAAAQGKWDAFNQQDVTDNGIAPNDLGAIENKHGLNGTFPTSQREMEAYDEAEREKDDLLGV